MKIFRNLLKRKQVGKYFWGQNHAAGGKVAGPGRGINTIPVGVIAAPVILSPPSFSSNIFYQSFPIAPASLSLTFYSCKQILFMLLQALRLFSCKADVKSRCTM
jgi:hypothetical protein